MKVVTKLAKMEFTIGTISRKGDNLVLESGGGPAAMKVRAQITPQDMLATIRGGLNWGVITFALQLPILIRRQRILGRQSPRSASIRSAPFEK